MTWAVFLDRDGVLNRNDVCNGRPYAPTTLSDFEFLPDVHQALQRLDAAGALLVVATNQPDMGEGKVPQCVVEAMHDRILSETPVTDIRVCYHTDRDECDCRKPKPGMLLAAAAEHNIDLSRSYMVGDRWRDVSAGIAAGCKTILIDYQYDESGPNSSDITVTSLLEAAEVILKDHQQPSTEGMPAMTPVSELNVEIFADGADIDGISMMAANPLIKGFTTNPTLMRRAGISDYEAFAREVLEVVTDLPVSFEVFADDFEEMANQALEISSWGANVNVKIPITNTKGESSADLVEKLSKSGVSVNVTALMELSQVETIAARLEPDVPAFVSVFAGRIADTGLDPIPVMADAVRCLRDKPAARLIWASPRELLNIFHAEQCGCHIITVTNDVLAKLPMIGKNLAEYSLETVKMFYSDAQSAGYSIFTETKQAVGE